LDTACVKTLDSIPAKATGYMYRDAELTDEHYRYLLGDTVYVKVVIDSVGPMALVTLGTVTVVQEDRSWVISDGNAPAFNFEELTPDNQRPEEVFFSLNLADSLEVDISGTETYLEADVTVEYGNGNGRRLLGVMSLDLEAGFLSVGRKLQLFPVPCENPTTLPGRYIETPCPLHPHRSLVQVCSKTGWKVVVDDCFDTKITNWFAADLASTFDDTSLWFWQVLCVFTTLGLVLATSIMLLVTKMTDKNQTEI